MKGPVTLSTLNVSFEQRVTSGAESISYTLVQLEGFIDAPNYPRFEQALERLTDSGRHHLVLDCRNVEYINSTGISGIIRFHNQCARSDGALVLARVARNVGITMHLLGVTSVVPVAKDLAEAEAILTGQKDAETVTVAGSKPGTKTTARTSSGKEVRSVPVMAEPAGPSGTVAMLLPTTGHFAQICKRRVEERGGRVFLYHSVERLIEGIDADAPDLVVVDKRVTGSQQLVEKIKLDTRHALASTILIHPKGSDVAALEGFRVWENDSLVDPFDLSNLFILAESEVRRVSRDRKLFTQQVRFQFSSEQDAIDQGLSLGGALIQKLPLTEQEQNALHSALKEGVDNAVRHGNQHRPDRRVTVNYVVDPRRVMMLIEDEGDGFDHEFYLGKIEEKDAFDRAKERMREGGRGGLGILLMHRCSDRLEYLGKGNVVRIEKRLHA
ncbi:MAG: ATP-binding protein [Planctomycetes bacterium]|nr:ATP-binding protein [Planctomycetota bacterium]